MPGMALYKPVILSKVIFLYPSLGISGVLAPCIHYNHLSERLMRIGHRHHYIRAGK